MTTTVDDLIENTTRHLSGVHQSKFNFLTSTISANATTLTCDLAMNGIVAGALLSIDDELLYVKSVAGQVATVARGWLGSTGSAHQAGVAIEVQSRFPRFAIMEALKEEIGSWPRSLYRVADPITLSGSTSSRGYDLTGVTDLINVIEVRRSPYGTGSTWPRVKNYELDRHADTTDFPSGFALYIADAFSESVSIRVTYTAPFDLSQWDADTDLEDEVGLATTMLDIPCYGAAWRLVAPRDIKRTFTEAQTEPRLTQDVPAGSAVRVAAAMKALRDQRIVEEADRLAASVVVRW